MPLLRSSARPPRRGVVLLAVMVVIVLLTLAAYQYNEWGTAEYRGATSYARSAEAEALANSGVHYTAALLGNQGTAAEALGGNPYDNAQAFRDITVPSTGSNPPGRFSVVALGAPDDPSGQPYRFGVVDEA